jgi:hypothetical protein
VYVSVCVCEDEKDVEEIREYIVVLVKVAAGV